MNKIILAFISIGSFNFFYAANLTSIELRDRKKELTVSSLQEIAEEEQDNESSLPAISQKDAKVLAKTFLGKIMNSEAFLSSPDFIVYIQETFKYKLIKKSSSRPSAYELLVMPKEFLEFRKPRE